METKKWPKFPTLRGGFVKYKKMFLRPFGENSHTESWAHRELVSDAPLSSVLDENFLHASICDVFALVTDALHTSY